MSKRKEGKKESNSDWFNWLLTILALAFSAYSVYVSREANRISEASNDISIEAKDLSATSIALNQAPNLEILYFVASSPDLSSNHDTNQISSLDVSVRLLKTSYWRQISSISDEESNVDYLFIFILNYGRGTALDLNLNASWIPEPNRPNGFLDFEGESLILPPGQLCALIIDTIDDYDPTQELKDQVDLHFDRIEFVLEYDDEIMQEHFIEFMLPGSPPANIDQVCKRCGVNLERHNHSLKRTPEAAANRFSVITGAA